MRVLGIADGFGAGVALVEDGVVQFAVSEERLSRIKNHSGYYHGFPDCSIEVALKATGWAPDTLDQTAISNFAFPPIVLRLRALYRSRPMGGKEFLDRHEFSQTINSRLYSVFSERRSGSPLGRASASIYRRALGRKLQSQFGFDCPIVFVDHHRCHAASAYFTQDQDNCLVMTLDCHGDGLSGSVSVASGGRLRRIAAFPAAESLGSFYAAVTNYLGFHHHRHEGKVTGLAAYGDPSVAEADVRRMIAYDPDTRRIKCHLGRNQFISIARIRNFLTDSYSREDIAAAAQRQLERIVLQIVGGFLEETSTTKVLLAGGVFANVKLNQRINELPGVSHLFIHPGMGDEGLPVGAALAASAARGAFQLGRIENVFWGPAFGQEEIDKALASCDFPYERCTEIEIRIAELLAQKRIVARFDGRLEYGPRALGNRSILFHAGDTSVNDWLNASLKRSEFMPFAPATLIDRAGDCFEGLESAKYAAEFMTVCCNCTRDFRERCPAVVHVDGTARPQLIDERSNPSFHKILSHYERLTGIPTIINTSFNIHEEPIVCTPQDAVRAFAAAELDYLALGDCLVSRRIERDRSR
jgi:carbamoyltransferase